MSGKTFSRCELARELLRQGFSRQQLSDWVCLVESESSRQTGVKGGPNDDGSYDWGLFQINDRYWCNDGSSPGKGCNVRCSDLLSSNISKSSNCAKTVYRTHGFDGWYGWQNRCKGKNIPNVLEECGL